ncbi:hypothetical protein KHA80_12435 [Anaerobacillus sp. HL2]|nr:hypothetical protein KHA80_12435 [Anaerobacillus sp. HL2]
MSPEEKVEEEQLEWEVKLLNQELYEVVDESLHGQGENELDQMTENYVPCMRDLRFFEIGKEKVEEERKALKRFMKNLKA